MTRSVFILLLFLLSALEAGAATTAGFPATFSGTTTTNFSSIGAVQKQNTGAAGFPAVFSGTTTTNYQTIGAVQKDVAGASLTAGTLTITAHTVDCISVSWTSASGGTAPITAQLQKSPAGAGTWSNVSGATTSPWDVTGLTASTSYDFRVVYTDAVPNSVNSNTATQATDATAVVVMTSPKAYQVIARQGISANIALTGTYTGTPSAIEAKWGNGPWTTIVASPPAAGPGASFSGTLANQYQGQGTLTVRFVNDNTVTASANYVGIGLIFTCTGQSNMDGQGNNNQTYTHPVFKACLFGNDYAWKELVDPYDSNAGQIDIVSSDTAAGSFILPLATQLMAYFQCPVAFVPCSKTSTSIANWAPGSNHQDRNTLYGSSVYRSLQAGTSGVLRWQGETDAVNSVSTASYNASLETEVNAYWADLGVKVFAMILQNCSDPSITDDPSALDNIRTATSNAFTDLPTKCGLLADLRDMATDDGFHEKTDANLATVATRSAGNLKPAFFSMHKAAFF